MNPPGNESNPNPNRQSPPPLISTVALARCPRESPAPPLISTVALARCPGESPAPQLFQQFLSPRAPNANRKSQIANRKSPDAILALSLLLLAVAPGLGQNATNNASPSTTQAPKTNTPVSVATTNTPNASSSAPKPAEAKPGEPSTNGTDEIQLSLQNANIDMVLQWLSQNTGKPVIKSPTVQCQLTIASPRKVPKREAINLIYRALALQNIAVTEASDAIYITREGQEPKLNPVVLGATQKTIPEGRQRIVKIFQLSHVSPGEIKEMVRSALSPQGTIETDDRANQLIVTDYNDNLRLLAELIQEFDVASSDTVIKIFPLHYAGADDIANLIGLILNAQAGAAGAAPKPSPGGGAPPVMHGPIQIGGPPGMMMASMSHSASSAPALGIGSQVSAPQARIWPDRTANRLIVSAAKAKLPEIQRLIDILDVQKPQDVSVRVVSLKHVGATDLAKELSPLYQRMSGRSPKDSIDVAADDRSNSLIVLSSEANFKAVETLVAALDTEEAQEEVVRTFVLTNADAQDVAKQLQDLNKNQQNSEYPYYIFFPSSPQQNQKQVSVVADRRRNAVIVQAPPAQMDGIAKMIQQLDEPVGDKGLAPRIYHLKYVSAVDVEDVLNDLFLKKTQQRNYFYYFDENQEPQPDRDVGRLYGKVRITSEPYSNTIIITSNSEESLRVVENVIKQLDLPSEAGESTLRVRLKFAKATEVANNINILFAKNGSPPLRQQPQPNQQPVNYQQPQQQQQQSSSTQPGFDLGQEAKEEQYYPWLGGQPDNYRTGEGRNAVRPVSDLVGRVRAVADERSNAVLISANVHFFPQIMKLVDELDAPADQVLIEARLVEVSTDYLDQLGVRWSPNGNQVFTADDYDDSLLAHASGGYQTGFGGRTTINSPNSSVPPAGSASPIAQALTSLRTGVLDSTINMDFLVQFLRRTTDARVLAEPQINIRDNETGRLFVGQQVPILTGQNNPALGGTVETFVYKAVGVILEVTPHINSTGDVELKIHAESSTVVPGETVLGGVVIDTRYFHTDLTSRNGETLVLGGIIQKEVTDTIRKVPILGDIPGLGWAFKKKDKTSQNMELIVFLRPKVIRTPEDARTLLQDTYKKAPQVKQWNEQSQQEDQKAMKD